MSETITNPSYDKLAIWNQVATTDPKHTKEVSQRGGFTSIDAMYNIQRATEVFGPVGRGWGYRTKNQTLLVGKDKDQALAIVDLAVWHADPLDPDKIYNFGPIRATNVLIDAKGRIDEDAFKKAMTDALTKGLSHLGFSADVFLGKFDDDRYVSAQRRKFAEGRPAEAPAIVGTAAPAAAANSDEQNAELVAFAKTSIETHLPRFESLQKLDEWREANKPKFESLARTDRSLALLLSGAIARTRERLLNGKDAA